MGLAAMDNEVSSLDEFQTMFKARHGSPFSIDFFYPNCRDSLQTNPVEGIDTRPFLSLPTKHIEFFRSAVFVVAIGLAVFFSSRGQLMMRKSGSFATEDL